MLCFMATLRANEPVEVGVVFMPAVGAGYIDGVIGHRS